MAVEKRGQDFVAIVGERRRNVRVERIGEECRVRIDGKEYRVGGDPCGNGELCLLVNGAPRTIHIRQDEEGCYRVMSGGGWVSVEIADPLVERLKRTSGPAERTKRIEIRSPMPGTVVDVRVCPGDEVEAETALIVLEAMKMQNALASPARGIVREVRAGAGQTVEGDALLIVLDRAPEEPLGGTPRAGEDGAQ